MERRSISCSIAYINVTDDIHNARVPNDGGVFEQDNGRGILRNSSTDRIDCEWICFKDGHPKVYMLPLARICFYMFSIRGTGCERAIDLECSAVSPRVRPSSICPIIRRKFCIELLQCMIVPTDLWLRLRLPPDKIYIEQHRSRRFLAEKIAVPCIMQNPSDRRLERGGGEVHIRGKVDKLNGSKSRRFLRSVLMQPRSISQVDEVLRWSG